MNQSKEKIKLLRLTNCIMHYSLPTYNALAEYYDLTVAHYGNRVDDSLTNFKQIILTKRNIGSFVYFKENIYQLAKKFDTVLALGDLHILPYVSLGLIPRRKFAVTYWTIGVSASYNKKFDEDKSLDWIRFRLMDFADSLVFYSEYPIKRYTEKGVKREKLFVAQNSVFINNQIEIPKNKKYFLFVGTLYKAKKIYELLEAYLIAFELNKMIAPLVIVGDGDEKDNIGQWIEEHNLQNHISIKGPIYDSEELCEIHKYAIASISPGQAGLSVLTSMAYGVPFITTYDAITGGERLNIEHGVNGFLYDGNIETLSGLIGKLSFMQEEVHQLGKNAQDHYFNNRQHAFMINSVIDSVNFAINSKQK
jgi:glycosyltransferase involved in cell wall biosynthesis